MSYSKAIVTVDKILQKEAAKRAASNAALNGGHNFYYLKHELKMLEQILPELRRAINSADRQKILEICLLSNKRLNAIFNHFK